MRQASHQEVSDALWHLMRLKEFNNIVQILLEAVLPNTFDSDWQSKKQSNMDDVARRRCKETM